MAVGKAEPGVHDESSTLGRVAVVVLTFRRVDDLLELLPQLRTQIASNSHDDFEIIVVDNDPEASAAAAVQKDLEVVVRYVHEPAPGIAVARNRALDEAREAQLLIFIDDDERPLETWLEAMLRAYRQTLPAGVAGPVYPEYEGEAEPWIRDGGFFVRREWPDGHEVGAAGSGNLLLDMRQVRSWGLRFDERFGLTGGSDYFFTRRMVQLGGRIVWSQGAAVTDKVPRQRSTRRWVLRRAYRVGTTWSRTALELATPGHRRLGARILMTGQGVARIVYGSARAALGAITRSARHHAQGSRAVLRGIGQVSGAWGATYEEYRRRPAQAPR